MDAVDRLIGDMHAFERLLRSTYAAAGKLSMSAAEAQADRNLSLLSGHQVLGAISGAQVAVSEAISRIATGHRQLEVLGRSLGMDVTGFGETKPPSVAALTETAPYPSDVAA